MNSADIQMTSEILKEVPACSKHILSTLERLKKSIDVETSKGLSFLDLKNSTFLSYVTNLLSVIHQKIMGYSIENDPAINRLIEQRIVLEKMKPIEERLKYQITKLLTSAVSGKIDSSDPLQFKAKPENLVNEENTTIEENTSKIYVPPKISASYFEDDPSNEGRMKRIAESSKKRALSNSVLYELRKEYDTGPDEIKEAVNPHKIKFIEEMKERTMYEEEYMTRLRMTKRYKHEKGKQMTITNFNSNLDDLSFLEMDSKALSGNRKSGFKNSKFMKRKLKKKGKKKKHH